jgi:hypothetical protein
MKKLNLLLIMFLTIVVNAQTDTTTVYRITLNDHSEIVGTIITSNKQEVIFLSLAGVEMKVPKTQIREINPVKGKLKNGTFYRTDPNKTRLLFAPTGRMLEPGKGYFSIYELFFPSLSVGITNFLSINGGISLIPGLKEQIYYFAPKIGYETSNNFSIGVGYLYLGIPDEDPLGLLYSVATVGDDRNAFTFGGGVGLAKGEFSKTPVFMLGGEVSLSNSIKLLSENWILNTKDSHPLVSIGIRFYGEHIAGDFGLIIPTGVHMDGFAGIPWVGFIYNF